MKKCFKCGVNKKIKEFYRHAKMGDGHLNKCIDCTKRDALLHRTLNIEKIREYDFKRSKTKKRLKLSNINCKIYRKKNPEKYKAHSIVNRAIRAGKLKKKTCIVCKSKKSLAHHEDYSKPLDVIWYCQIHHIERHKEIKKEKNDIKRLSN